MKTKEQILTSNLRDTLKNIMQNEIEQLPKTLESLEPKERVNLVCKLMPYVFPKVESVSLDKGELIDYDIMRH